jgi:hypothetical protein
VTFALNQDKLNELKLSDEEKSSLHLLERNFIIPLENTTINEDEESKHESSKLDILNIYYWQNLSNENDDNQTLIDRI